MQLQVLSYWEPTPLSALPIGDLLCAVLIQKKTVFAADVGDTKPCAPHAQVCATSATILAGLEKVAVWRLKAAKLPSSPEPPAILSACHEGLYLLLRLNTGSVVLLRQAPEEATLEVVPGSPAVTTVGPNDRTEQQITASCLYHDRSGWLMQTLQHTQPDTVRSAANPELTSGVRVRFISGSPARRRGMGRARRSACDACCVLWCRRRVPTRPSSCCAAATAPWRCLRCRTCTASRRSWSCMRATPLCMLCRRPARCATCPCPSLSTLLAGVTSTNGGPERHGPSVLVIFVQRMTSRPVVTALP